MLAIISGMCTFERFQHMSDRESYGNKWGFLGRAHIAQRVEGIKQIPKGLAKEKTEKRV